MGSVIPLKCSRRPDGICAVHGSMFPTLSDGVSAYCLIDHRETAIELARGARARIARLREEIAETERTVEALESEAAEWKRMQESLSL